MIPLYNNWVTNPQQTEDYIKVWWNNLVKTQTTPPPIQAPVNSIQAQAEMAKKQYGTMPLTDAYTALIATGTDVATDAPLILYCTRILIHIFY